MLKVGMIRCQQTEDMCPGNTDFKVAKAGKLAFEETGPVEVVGFVSCGGCPGKRAIIRAKTPNPNKKTPTCFLTGGQ